MECPFNLNLDMWLDSALDNVALAGCWHFLFDAAEHPYIVSVELRVLQRL